ncbi:hypothetical protein BDB00DRAFT_22240 [Zychaea mexicana]|uniref:uncharacterized protein n=1 Tax=Zychaea mexicana TaxID=64656 RepID=UPI0022FE2AE9|nr:uncharacterized protein BDB00DRAFT_22240 [Zychaea mexicana]KAI9497266.1 hypothetical protein BDB00DRAFT_22240 [Zychaea mexicana]
MATETRVLQNSNSGDSKNDDNMRRSPSQFSTAATSATIVPTYDLQQSQLNHIHESECNSGTATTITNVIVDRVASLPQEILSRILMLLTVQELTTVMNISCTWRNRVATCREAWSTILISRDSYPDFVPSLEDAAPHVMHLKMLGLSSDQCNSVYAVIKNGHFKKLCTIDIEG